MNRDDNARLRDLEQCVLGAVLLDPGALDLLPSLDALDFHDLRARAVFGAIRSLAAAGRPVDAVTVEGQLAADGTLDAAGGTAYLGACAVRVPTTENAIEYARLVQDASLRRRVCIAISEVLERVKAERSTGDEALSLALAALSRLDAEQPDDAAPVGEWIRQRGAELERIASARAEGRDAMTGYPTGVAKLDTFLGGWQPGIVTIVAARPSMGKSSLALATADASSRAGFGVHVFSLEDSRSAYADRAMARESGVPAESIRAVTLSRQQFADLSPAMGRLRFRKGWLVDDRSGLTADEIVRSVRRHRRRNTTRVVVVDYIQLLRPPRGCRPGHEALTAAITALADAAKQDGIAYVVLSQLNRELEKRADKRPQLSDLRESGSLEERSKCVVGIYRGAFYGDPPRRGVDFECGCKGPDIDDVHAPARSAWEAEAQLLVLKNSNGRTGRVWAAWHGPTTTIR